MRERQFTDCVDIVGASCKPFEGNRRYISTGAVATDHIDESDVEIVDYKSRPSRADLIVEPGTLLFAKMQGTKKTLYVDKEKAENIYSTGFFALKAKSGVISTRCLYHMLGSTSFLTQKDKNCSGATQKAITNAGLKKIRVSIPDYQLQEAIADQLDKISSVIQMRRSELQKLDDLVKARFVEMFGTLDNPARQFEYFTLKELCSKITDGKHGGCIQESGTQRYFVGAREIYDDEVHYDTAPEISIADFEKDYKRCNLEIGDFLIVNTGATIGKSAIASDYRTEKTLLQKSVALLKVKRELLDPVFLQWCYRVNANMYMVESASAQPNLLLSKINSTKIYVPEIELQSQFSSFVEQVDKSKFVESIHVLKLIKEAIAKEVSHDRIR